MNAALKKFLYEDVLDFQGGLPPILWQAIEPLAQMQKANQIDLPVCEIGVHHGKFLIALILTKGGGRGHLGIDVFDLQMFNMDRSGFGDHEIFMRNIEQFCGSRDMVSTIKEDSLNIGLPEIVEIHRTHGKFSMFSIDGCHTAEHTFNDLVIAEQLTCHGGLIFIDDYYHPNFPGVQEGVSKFFFTRAARFVPICYLGGKLILTDASHHKQYLNKLRKALEQRTDEIRVVSVKRFGWDTITIGPALVGAPGKRSVKQRG